MSWKARPLPIRRIRHPYALEAAIKVYHVDRSKIKLVPLKPAEIVAAWKRGDIDGAYAWDPASQELAAAGGHEILVTKQLQKDGYLIYNNFVVRKAFAEQYPKLVATFLRVYQQKVDEYHQDPERAAQIIAKNIDQPLDSVRRNVRGPRISVGQRPVVARFPRQRSEYAAIRYREGDGRHRAVSRERRAVAR